MPWFKAKTFIRCNKKRYLRGEVYELDAVTAKMNDNFVPCDAPKVAAQATKSAAPAPAKPVADDKPKVDAAKKP